MILKHLISLAIYEEKEIWPKWLKFGLANSLLDSPMATWLTLTGTLNVRTHTHAHTPPSPPPYRLALFKGAHQWQPAPLAFIARTRVIEINNRRLPPDFPENLEVFRV